MSELLEALRARCDRPDRGLRFGSAEAPLVSYMELWKRAESLSFGLSPGDRVLLVGDNSQAQVEALLGCCLLYTSDAADE